MWILIVILLAGLVALIILAAAEPLPFAAEVADGGGRILVVVTLFGIICGALSAIRQLSSKSTRARIPAQRTDWVITAARPFIGAAAAIAAYAFLQAGVLPLERANGAVIATVAFIAGFSEQLIMRTVESVAGKAQEGIGA